MKKDNIYAELKNLYSTKLETLLENYKTIGSDYTILGFDRNKAFILSHRNGAMYLVEGENKVQRLDLNTDEYERRFKVAIREFVEAVVSDKPILAQSKKRELREVIDEQIYLFSLPFDGVIPLKESVRKKIFDYLMENQLFKEYLIKLGNKVKNNQTVIIEAIPYIGLRARDKLIKFFREQIELSYDQARTLAVALLNLAFGKQYNESFKAKNLYNSINSVLPPSKARELTYFILETAGRAMLNEFKVETRNLSDTIKSTPIDAPKNGKIIVEPKDVGRVIDDEGKVLEPGEYNVEESDEKGASVSSPKGKYKHLKLLPETKTYFKETENPNPEEISDIEEELPEDISLNTEQELENALTILKRVFKEEVSELSESTEETFEENEKGFKNLMGSITNLEKYINELKTENEIEEDKDIKIEEPTSEEFTDEEPKTKQKTPDIDIEDILDKEEEQPKSKKEPNIEDILDKPIKEKNETKDKSLKEKNSLNEDNDVEKENFLEEDETEDKLAENDEVPDFDIPEENEDSNENEQDLDIPDFNESEEDKNSEENDLKAPDYTKGVFDEELPTEEGENETAPDYTNGIFNDEETSKDKVVNVGDAFIFDSHDDIKDNEGIALVPDEVYTVVAIDEDKNEVALADEKGVKSIVSIDDLSKYNNYFSPVKSLSEGTILEAFEDNILDNNDQPLPIGEYELIQLDEENGIAKISNLKTNKLYTLDLDNLGNMGIVKMANDLVEPDEESDIPKEPEKTEYSEEDYDETASEIAQIVDREEAPDYSEIKEDDEKQEVEQTESSDDKIEINIKIPADKVNGSKLEDLMFGLSDNQITSNAEKNSEYLYKPTNEETTSEEDIPTSILNNKDKEVKKLYKDLLTLEKQITDYIEKNKQIYQMEDESNKYIALIDKMKKELETNATDAVKQSVKDFLAVIKDEEEEFVDNSAPAPTIDLSKEGE
jgi:hypothetical protein